MRQAQVKQFMMLALAAVVFFISYLPSIASGPLPVLTDGQLFPKGLQSPVYEGTQQTITCTYQHNGFRITLEVRRGEPTSPLMKKTDPDAPEYEIDIRLLDDKGFPFFVQVGGDSPIEPAWAIMEEAITATPSLDRAERADLAFTAATKMVESLCGLSFKPEFAPEKQAITGILPLLQDALIFRGVAIDEPLAPSTATCPEQQYIEIWKKPTVIVAEHSGTVAQVRSASGSNIYQMWSACNHGTCPGGSGMSKKCSKAFLNRCPVCAAAPMCSTSYGFTRGTHVCNDDTYIQYYRIIYNANPSTTGGTCSDSSLRMYAPSCW